VLKQNHVTGNARRRSLLGFTLVHPDRKDFDPINSLAQSAQHGSWVTEALDGYHGHLRLSLCRRRSAFSDVLRAASQGCPHRAFHHLMMCPAGPSLIYHANVASTHHDGGMEASRRFSHLYRVLRSLVRQGQDWPEPEVDTVLH
jgi:hypothetical protein